jgi:hypothetical protein
MRTLHMALAGALAAGGALLAVPQKAEAQYYGDYGYNNPYYGYNNPYGYVPARRGYRGARQYYNQRYGTYYDVYGRRPATLGYCQRNPGRCM